MFKHELIGLPFDQLNKASCVALFLSIQEYARSILEHVVVYKEYATYHSVTTSFEYVFVGTDFALARPVKMRICQLLNGLIPIPVYQSHSETIPLVRWRTEKD